MGGEHPSDAVPPEPDFPSGEWVGFYREHGSNHRQELHLEFSGGRMTGDGADDVGRFVVRGRYDRDSREVWWTKTYPGSHDVLYKGYREIKGIWGLWEIPPGQRDGFHIWPRAEGDLDAAQLSEAREQPAEATSGPAAPLASPGGTRAVKRALPPAPGAPRSDADPRTARTRS